jgi:DNA-binding PadR family transcriptional regulator
MATKAPDFRLTTLRSLVLVLFLNEHSRDLHVGEVADMLVRQPESIRPLLKAAEDAGLLASRWESSSEVEARYTDGPTSRRRYYRLTEHGTNVATKAALDASPELMHELEQCQIRLDRGHNLPDQAPGFSDDARLTLLVFLADPGREWHRHEVATMLGLTSDHTHVLLTRLTRMGWVASRRESISEAPAGRLLRYRVTDAGLDEARQVRARLTPHLRVRAHFLGIPTDDRTDQNHTKTGDDTRLSEPTPAPQAMRRPFLSEESMKT